MEKLDSELPLCQERKTLFSQTWSLSVKHKTEQEQRNSVPLSFQDALIGGLGIEWSIGEDVNKKP